MENWELIATVLGCVTGLGLFISFLHTIGVLGHRKDDDKRVGKHTALHEPGMSQGKAVTGGFWYERVGTSEGRTDVGWDYDYKVLGA